MLDSTSQLQKYKETESKVMIQAIKDAHEIDRIATEDLSGFDEDDLKYIFVHTSTVEIFAWLTRARVFEEFLKRNAKAGNPKTEKAIAEELAELQKLHYKTIIRDSKIAGLFIKYKIDFSKRFYQLLLPLPVADQALIVRMAKADRNRGQFSLKKVKAKIKSLRQTNKATQVSGELIHKITLQITDRELADLRKIERGFKNVAGFHKGALGYAIRSFQAEMARLKIEGYPDKDWIVRTIIKVTKADMANRQSRAGFESQNKKKEINDDGRFEY